MRAWQFRRCSRGDHVVTDCGCAGGVLADGEVWQHKVVRYVLPHVVVNTLSLTLSVALLTLLIGAALAWLTAACEFPGQRWFSWALMLPLAMPGYVIAFALTGVFEYGGAYSTFLRTQWGIDSPALPAGLASALCLSLTLYPYVYLLARQAFLTQGVRSLEAAQSLGMTRRQGFFRITLPMARPWLAAGVALVCMETLADFGTVKVFSISTR